MDSCVKAYISLLKAVFFKLGDEEKKLFWGFVDRGHLLSKDSAEKPTHLLLEMAFDR